MTPFSNPTIIVAIITFIGVVAGVLVSFIANRRLLKHEIAKLKSSIEQTFSSEILKERQKRYPDIYAVISKLAKHLKVQQEDHIIPEFAFSKTLLSEIFNEMEKMDNLHGLFFSVETSYHVAKFRHCLHSAMSILNEDKVPLSKAYLNEMRTSASIAEMGLKKDIGILIDEFQSIRQDFKTHQDYMDALDKMYSKYWQD